MGNICILRNGVYLLDTNKSVGVLVDLNGKVHLYVTHLDDTITNLDDTQIISSTKDLLYLLIEWIKRYKFKISSNIHTLTRLLCCLMDTVREKWKCTKKPLFTITYTDIDGEDTLFVKAKGTVFKIDKELNLTLATESEMDLVYRKGNISIYQNGGSPIIRLNEEEYTISLGGTINKDGDKDLDCSCTITTLTEVRVETFPKYQILHLINLNGECVDVLVEWETGNFYYFYDTDIISQCIHRTSNMLIRAGKSVPFSVDEYIKLTLPRVTYFPGKPKPKVDEVPIGELTVYDNEKAYIFKVKEKELQELGGLKELQSLVYVTRNRKEYINKIYDVSQ